MDPEESLANAPVFSDAEFRELEESPLDPEEESHGVAVVVVARHVAVTVMLMASPHEHKASARRLIGFHIMVEAVGEGIAPRLPSLSQAS